MSTEDAGSAFVYGVEKYSEVNTTLDDFVGVLVLVRDDIMSC